MYADGLITLPLGVWASITPDLCNIPLRPLWWRFDGLLHVYVTSVTVTMLVNHKMLWYDGTNA